MDEWRSHSVELTGHGKLCEGASENLVWRHVHVPHCSHPYQLSSTVRRDAVRYDLLVKVAFANFRSEVHIGTCTRCNVARNGQDRP